MHDTQRSNPSPGRFRPGTCPPSRGCPGGRLDWSRHALARARTRAIDPAVAELAYEVGRRPPDRRDRYLLTADAVRSARPGGRSPRLLARAEKAAPIVVVVRDGLVLTVFRPVKSIFRSWNRRRGRRSRRLPR